MNDLTPTPRPKTKLYLITPPRFDLESFVVRLERALGAGEVAAVQLRLKDVSDDEILTVGERLKPLVQSAGGVFFVNDRPDLARRIEADGVHIGQQDWPIAKARAEVGRNALIGVTCHDSRHLAIEAGEAGADYVAFGAFYPTSTKTPPAVADPDLLAWWQAIMELPCVAIGGVTPANAEPLVRAGADFVAAASGVWDWPDGEAAAVKAFNAIFDRVTPQG